LEPLTRQDIHSFYEKYYYPAVSILTVVGDVTIKEVKESLQSTVEQWRENQEKPDDLFSAEYVDGPKTVRSDMPLSQATVILGHKGIKRTNPDYPALVVLNTILGGGGLSSRLMERIRVEHGFAYSVSSHFTARKHPDIFQIRFQTKNESVAPAVSLALAEMKRLQQEAVPEKELERAKQYLIGNFPLQFSTLSGLAEFHSKVAYYGLGPDYADQYLQDLKAVTREDVLEAAKNYLHPEGYVLSIVGDTDKIDDVPGNAQSGAQSETSE
jgi:zinc protease